MVTHKQVDLSLTSGTSASVLHSAESKYTAVATNVTVGTKAGPTDVKRSPNVVVVQVADSIAMRMARISRLNKER